MKIHQILPECDAYVLAIQIQKHFLTAISKKKEKKKETVKI